MKKIAGFVLIPAAALVMVGGWAFWVEAVGEGTGVDGLVEVADDRVAEVDRAVERVDRAVERVDRVVDRRVAAVDRIVEENDRRIDAINLALDRSLDGANPAFTVELDRLQARVNAGELSQREAVRQAVRAAVRDGVDVPQSIVEADAELERTQADASRQIAEATAQVEALRNSGEISQERYAELVATLGRLQERLQAEEPVGASE